MIRNSIFLIALFLVLVFACEDEEISVSITNSNVQQLLTGSDQQTWVLTANGDAGFDPCIDEEQWVFTDLVSDTGMVYGLKPRVLCDDTDTLNEMDTIFVYQWVIPDTVGTTFEDSLLFLDDDTLINLIITKLEPEEISFKFLTDTQPIHDFERLVE